MGVRLVTTLVPLLAEPTAPEFNVFQVLHHGTHEKQISNLFAWLLDPDGTHQLGETFQRIFVDHVARSWPGARVIDSRPYSVRQEVNTSPPDEAPDIADLVLESEESVIVVENYRVSDGHGHNFHRYRDYGARNGKIPVVVMLCGASTPADLTEGWEDSAVVTYTGLIDRLTTHVRADPSYQDAHPEQYFFLNQMHAHFVKGRYVNDTDLIDFVGALCDSGDARYYQQSPDAKGAMNFADSLRERAVEQFAESRDLLWRVKDALKSYCAGTLRVLINDALSGESIVDVKANHQGIYQWTVILRCAEGPGQAERVMLVKFGPSAWYANEIDARWTTKVPHDDADYTHVFLLVGNEVRQSAVTIQEVLSGIQPGDLRLRDEILSMLRRR